MTGKFRLDVNAEIDGLPPPLDADTLAATQGVGHIEDFRSLKADVWPADESVDAFLSVIRDSNRKHRIGMLSRD